MAAAHFVKFMREIVGRPSCELASPQLIMKANELELVAFTQVTSLVQSAKVCRQTKELSSRLVAGQFTKGIVPLPVCMKNVQSVVHPVSTMSALSTMVDNSRTVFNDKFQ